MMLKKIIFLLFLCLPSFAQAQTQLTHLEDSAYQSPIKEVFEWQDRVFYAFENGMGKVEIWEFANEQLSKVYETPFQLCDFDLHTWKIYQDKIFIGGYYSFRSIDFLTGEITEEIFSDEPHFVSPIVRYEFDECLAKIKITNEVEHIYDIELQALVPVFEGDLVYKSATAYYYVTGPPTDKVFMKRLFFESEGEAIASGFSNYAPHIINDILYFQGPGIPFYRVSGDSVDSFSSFSFMIDMYLTSDDQLYGIEQVSSAKFLHLLDPNALTILETKNASDFIPSQIYTANDEKVFFSSVNVILNAAELAYWDLIQDTIIVLDTEPYVYTIQVQDSLLFNATWDYQNPKLEVINTNTLDIKAIDFPPYSNNEFRGTQQVFKKDENYFISLYDAEHGYGFFDYDDQNNTLTPTVAFPEKNYGTGTTIGLSGNTLFINDFDEYTRHIQIYEPTASDGIYLHEIEAALDGGIEAINGKFYYLLDHDFGTNPPSDSNYVDLVMFNPETKTTHPLLEAIAYPPSHSFSRPKVAGQYILLPNQYDTFNLKVFDTENMVQLEVTTEQKEILKGVKVVTDNWMYAVVLASGNRRVYKMQVDNLNNYELIHENEEATPSLVQISDDIINITINDSLFYYDGQNLVNYFSEEGLTFQQGSRPVYISPDKKYLAYKFSTVDDIGIILYDRVQNATKKLIVKNFLSLFSDTHDIHFGEGYMFYNDRNSNQEYELWSYNLTTDEQHFHFFDVNPQILSLHNGEVHVEIFADNSISIFSYDLDPIEIVSMGSLFNVWNYFNYPRSQMLSNPRIIRSHRPYTGSLSNYRLLNLYNAATRTVSPYFDCESELRFYSFVQQDSTLYCVASNDEEGNQIYKIDIENYVTSVKNASPEVVTETLQLFPNPTTGVLHFHQKLDNIHILDIQGRLIFESNEATKTLNVEQLHRGFYFIKGQLQNRYFNGKFVKL